MLPETNVNNDKFRKLQALGLALLYLTNNVALNGLFLYTCKVVGILILWLILMISWKTLNLNVFNYNSSHTTNENRVDGFKSDNDETIKKTLSVDSDVVQDGLMHSFEDDDRLILCKECNANKVDKVYTIGCFDLFHYGHVALFERMRQLGRTLIVGVHDSRSIYKLKNRVPVDSTEKRMFNVKKYADVVFCIPSIDPSVYMQCIIFIDKNETAMYVRGDDMPNFPSRDVVEKLMPIKLLPYTQGVSSTKLRSENYQNIKPDDINYLEENN